MGSWASRHQDSTAWISPSSPASTNFLRARLDSSTANVISHEPKGVKHSAGQLTSAAEGDQEFELRLGSGSFDDLLRSGDVHCDGLLTHNMLMTSVSSPL